MRFTKADKYHLRRNFMDIKFGPSGCGDEFYAQGHSGITEVPSWLYNYGLDAYEYSFGHGYQMSTETAKKAGVLFKQYNLALSLHAPFYINFANPDPVMYEKTKGYIKTGVKFLKAFGGDHLVFHPASCGKLQRQEALALTQSRFDQFFNALEQSENLDGLWLCPETMGKTMQIGTYKEVVDLCQCNKHLVPTFDFGHINSLEQGSLKVPQDYKKVFDYCIEKLGFERTNNCHIHFSKIQYGPKGEIKHLNFDDNFYGPNFEPLAQVLLEYNLTPRIICESMSMMPHDALQMKKIYLQMKENIENKPKH